MATITKIDLQEIAFTTADLRTELHCPMLRLGRHCSQRQLTAATLESCHSASHL